MIHLGVIGFGARNQEMLSEIKKVDPGCRVVAITDIRNQGIKENLGEDKAQDILFFLIRPKICWIR